MRSRKNIHIAAMVATLLGMGASTCEAQQAGNDGCKVTPGILTASSPGSGATDSSTLGLEYACQMTWSSAGDLASTDPYWSSLGKLAASGKLAANSSVNVGDMIDFSAAYGGEYYLLPQLPPPGQDGGVSGYGDFTVSLKGSYEQGQRLATSNALYGVNVFGFYTPAGGGKISGFLVNWPSLELDYARVNPSTDTPRKAVDPGLSSYNRVHERLSFGLTSPTLPGGRDLKFGFKLDHWQQPGASAAIAAAGLDRQTYRAYSLILPGQGSEPDWSVTYASGSVPTDQASAKVWQLGVTWNFK